jgi:hypothetical protein
MPESAFLAPNGWLNDWVSMAQIYPGYGGDPANGLNNTIDAFSGDAYAAKSASISIDPSDKLMLSGYMTYFGTGNVADNRFDLLNKASLTTLGKSPWAVSKDAGQKFRPILTVYLNDASTSESTFNLLMDINSTGGTTNNQSMAVNVLTNTALQIGAFQAARITSANPDAGINDPATTDLSPDDILKLRQLRDSNFVTGDVLLTPDGFGSFIKNYTSTTLQVNNDTSSIGNLPISSTKVAMSRTPDNMGWQVVNNDGEIVKTIPGSVSIGATTYTVEQNLVNANGLVVRLKDQNGIFYSNDTQDKQLNLKSTDIIDCRVNLQSALKYLKTQQSQYEKYGVIFPEIFYGTEADFNDFVENLPGYSPTRGLNLPTLAVSGNGTVSDILATQTYLAKLFAGQLNVSPVLNPWAVGNITKSPWYLDGRMFQDGSTLLSGQTTYNGVRSQLEMVAGEVDKKATDLGWFKASPYMDYITIDKYERDETSGLVTKGQNNAYNRNAWINFAYYAKVLSEQLRTGASSANNGTATGTGNSDLLYFQIPASSLASDLTQPTDFINGLAGQGADLNALNADPQNSLPHLSFAFDSFFGNTDLSSKTAFETKYPTLKDLTIKDTITLSDYLFSQSANALEDQGGQGSSQSHDLTQGILSIQGGNAIVNKEIFGDLFGIIWGGGNTSTPLSYSSHQWGADGSSWDAGSDLTTPYKPNQAKLIPLGNTVTQLASWSGAGYSGPTMNNEVSFRSRGLKYAAIKTDNKGSLDLAFAAQSASYNDVYIYKLNAATDLDAITGLTMQGNRPDAAVIQNFYEDITRNNKPIAIGLHSTTAGLDKGQVISGISVDKNAYYGVLVATRPQGGRPTKSQQKGIQYSTSYAAAGAWNGNSSKNRAVPTVSLVDANILNSKFLGGAGNLTNSMAISFEDSLFRESTDFDNNDVIMAITSGGKFLV